MSNAQLDAMIQAVRAERALPLLLYHYRRHGREFDATSESGYLDALHQHLRRRDLRVYSFLRPAGEVPFWALVAPDSGATVLYNEARGRLYSFYRPERPALRMAAVEAHWVELVNTTAGWQPEEHWQWQR